MKKQEIMKMTIAEGTEMFISLVQEKPQSFWEKRIPTIGTTYGRRSIAKEDIIFLVKKVKEDSKEAYEKKDIAIGALLCICED